MTRATKPTFRDRLRMARKAATMTQAAAARHIHPSLSVRTLESWEDGSREPPTWSQGMILECLARPVK